MTINPRLLDLLQEKLNVSRRRVYQLIAEREATLVLPREQAVLALALESGIRIRRFADSEDYNALRGAAVRKVEQDTKTIARAPKVTKTTATSASRRRPKRKRVFVVHGRNDDIRKSMFRFLKALSLEPIEWNRAVKATGKASPYVGEILDAAFKDAAAVVVLLTPDDEAQLRRQFRKGSDPLYESQLMGQARANVLFEAGMAFGTHDASTLLVQVGDVRPFSDIAGRHVVRMGNHLESRQEMVAKLEAAGCEVDTSGAEWLREGDFSVV